MSAHTVYMMNVSTYSLYDTDEYYSVIIIGIELLALSEMGASEGIC
jgi:hypothetical protein